eukprot:834123-Rhodomonas_salina.2
MRFSDAQERGREEEREEWVGGRGDSEKRGRGRGRRERRGRRKKVMQTRQRTGRFPRRFLLFEFKKRPQRRKRKEKVAQGHSSSFGIEGALGSETCTGVQDAIGEK